MVDELWNRRAFARATVTALGGLALAGRSSRSRAGEISYRPQPVRAVTKGPRHHFFGYYDKCPWDATGRYLLAHQSDFADRQPEPGEALTIGRIDLEGGDRFEPIGRTTAWSWQQGAMLQWLGTAPDRLAIYNTFDGDDYRATIRDVHSGASRTLSRPIYALSPDGTRAASLPFDRLNRLRPGYGYCARAERSPDDPAPADDGLWAIDTATGESTLIVPIARAAAHRPDARFDGAEHWFNHAVFSPSGTRITFLHRWKRPTDPRHTTRMYVVRPDGSDLRLVWDHDMVSHFDWRDDDTLLAWARDAEGRDRFFLRDVESGETSVLGEGVLTRDGHCSYSPDREWVLNDTYPDGERLQTLMLYRVSDGARIYVGHFLEPPKFAGPFRCDLHPRFNRDATAACIDSTHEGMSRQLYLVDVSAITRG